MKNLFETGTEPTEVQAEGQSVTQESQEQVSQEETNWDSKEKAVEAYHNLQRKNSELDLMVKQLAEEKIRAEERAKILEQFAQKPEPEIQVPQKPSRPQKPQGYSRADAIAYPDSESGKYEQALESYYDQKEVYDQWEKSQLLNKVETVTKSLEQKENERLLNEQYAQRKAAQISRLAQATGGDVNKAGKVFEFVQEAMGKDDPSWFVKLYDTVTGQPTLKTQQADQRSERQKYAAPGATIQGNGDNQNEAQKFMGDIAKRKNNRHDLFKTTKT